MVNRIARSRTRLRLCFVASSSLLTSASVRKSLPRASTLCTIRGANGLTVGIGSSWKRSLSTEHLFCVKCVPLMFHTGRRLGYAAGAVELVGSHPHDAG